MPFWISFTIRTFSWIHILGEQGLINVVLLRAGVINEPMPMLYTEGAVIMGLLHFLLPYMILNVYVSLESIDRTLISAARSMGCTSAQAFREVTLPLSLPGLGAGLLLCFVLAAGSYVTPQLLGGSRDALFGNLIYDTIMSQLNWPMGATLSIVLLCPVRLLRRRLYPLHGHVADHEGSRRMTARRGDQDGKWAWRLTGAVTLGVYIFLFAPIIATIVLSFNASMFGGFPLTGFSLQWYAKLLTNEQVMTAFKTSLWIALVTATVDDAARHRGRAGPRALPVPRQADVQHAGNPAGAGARDHSWRRPAGADQGG